MAAPNDLVAVYRAAPHRAVLRPALGIDEQAFDQALRDPPIMDDERQIDVDERVGLREALPCRCDRTEAVNDPLFALQQIRVDF
jgi:hypothetical protein